MMANLQQSLGSPSSILRQLAEHNDNRLWKREGKNQQSRKTFTFIINLLLLKKNLAIASHHLFKVAHHVFKHFPSLMI